MGDFLTGAKWGAWFLGITAGALWFWLAIGHHAVHQNACCARPISAKLPPAS